MLLDRGGRLSIQLIIECDSNLWVLVEEGIKSWREVVLSGKVTAPQSPEDKELYKKVWEQCETIYANSLSKGDYTTLPSYVAK